MNRVFNERKEPAERRDEEFSSSRLVSITHVAHDQKTDCEDCVAREEPLELQLLYGPYNGRICRSISVTMRTPGHDAELSVGFLLTEGVIRDAADIESVDLVHDPEKTGRDTTRNTVRVNLHPSVHFNMALLERNFYTTSSCGICGKASLLALRTVCPPRSKNQLTAPAGLLYRLPRALEDNQTAFKRTGGLHACGLFDPDGKLLLLREDIGRHNACDKLFGHEFLADRSPLRNRILLLSGRASFELLQKSVMAGIQMVVSIGAPSTLAIEVAREFDVTLVGFLRQESFNIYHGADRIFLSNQRRFAE